MTDEQYTFEHTRVRLEGILVEVRKKDTSLEQSLELLEEGVRLLNQCNELIDQTAWRPAVPSADEVAGDADAAGTPDAPETESGPAADEPVEERSDAADDPGDVEPEPAEGEAALEDDERD